MANYEGGNGVDSSFAEDTVLDNLGMTNEDFQDNSDGSGFVGPDADDGDVDNRQQPRSVTHTQEQQPQREQPRQRQQPDDLRADPLRTIPTRAEVKPDAKGNLVDAQGRIVARAGAHARHYQGYVQERHRSEQLSTANADLETRLNKAIEVGRSLVDRVNAFEAQTKQIKDLGLESSDQLNAMQMYSELKRDPVSTVKKMLTGLAAKGINVQDAFGTQGGVDPKALMTLIEEKISEGIKPLRERTEAERVAAQQQQETERVNQQVAKETQEFFDRNPDAKPYVPVFAKLLQDSRYRNWSLAELWVNIYKNRDRLQPAREQNSQQRSLPNSRGQQPVMRNDNDAAPVNQSYASIADEVMRQHGIV